ncbi:MAG: type II secretion system protein J [Candidatus Methylacidiphilales bacterium]
MIPPISTRRARFRSFTMVAAFTLVELCVALAVFSVLLIMMSQIISTVSQTWLAGAASVDNSTKSRVILGLIERDIETMVLRRDLAAFVDTSGATACAFYTRCSGGTGNRGVSLVQYARGPVSAPYSLYRYDRGLSYANSTGAADQLTYEQTGKLPDLTATTMENLADGVLAFEIQFVTAGGDLVRQYARDYTRPSAPANTNAAVISVVILDNGAYQIAGGTSTLSAAATLFTGTPPAGMSYAQMWSQLVDQPGFGSGLPQTVRSRIRVYQRRVSLPHTLLPQ